MKRSDLLIAGTIGLAGFAGTADARRRVRGDGFKTIPYIPQDAYPYYVPGLDLDKHWRMIDPLIRPAVKAINKSGWVWTAESCQGGHHWSASPLLRLVFRTADTADMLMALNSAAIVGEPKDHLSSTRSATSVELRRYAKAPAGWSELRVNAPLAYFDRLGRGLSNA